jgi:hypothetical protein
VANAFRLPAFPRKPVPELDHARLVFVHSKTGVEGEDLLGEKRNVSLAVRLLSEEKEWMFERG